MSESGVLDGWYNQTTVHPIGIIALLVLGVGALLVPRRYALLPIFIMACFIPSAQRIVVLSLDFNFLRVMVLCGWIRIVLRGEMAGWRWKVIDTVVVLWAVCATVMSMLLHYTVAEFVLRLGFLYDAVGLYFLCRVLVRDWNDVRVFIQSVAVISIPVAIAFLIERATARNMFSIFGGVPELTAVREGRLRCQGPFAHPILAGCFWAGLMPLIGALWWYGKWNRILAVSGLCASMVVVMTCASATAVNGMFFGFVAVALFPLRRWMSVVRWGGVVGLVCLQLIMINPLWHLFVRMNFIGGATGWYRFKLVDEFVRHFDDWWLMGSESYPTWWEWGLADITNEYVRQGVEGGLLTLALFVGILLVGFYSVGQMRRRSGAVRKQVLAWSLGASLFVHCIVFTSVAYFGQSILAWYLTIGFIGCLAPARWRRRTVLGRFRRRKVPPSREFRLANATISVVGS